MRLLSVLLLYISFLISCGIPQAKYDAVVTENEKLQQELAELKAEKEEDVFVRNHSQVVLPHTEIKELTSTFVDQTFTIKVKFPRGYEQSQKTYPVLYVTDAETNFGGVSYIVQRLIKDGLIPEIIVIGIAYNTLYRTFYRLRARDLTPTVVKNLRPGGTAWPYPTGGANDFSNFLAKELFPFVAKHYRVKKNDRALYGHSLGGLYGSYVLLHQPELFNKYLLLSPSLWWDKDKLITEVRELNLTFPQTRLYMASGEPEPQIDTLQASFISILKDKNPANLQMKSEIFETETHRTIFGTGFTNGLRFIYADDSP